MDCTEEKISLSPNAIKVLEKRYLKRDAQGKPVERPEDLFMRVASTLANADKKFGATDEEIKITTKKFYDFITNRYFMPNSPTLMNAGRELGQLAACFVLPVVITFALAVNVKFLFA